MRTIKKNALLMTAVATATVMISPIAAYAHPESGGQVLEDGVIKPGTGQHGVADGHLPATQSNVELVGRANIDRPGEGRVADVAAFGGTAYLTVRDPLGCSDAGVAIMDMSDPAAPRQTGFIEATEGSFPGEGAQVLDVATASFTGQVLLFNNETCLPPGADPATFVGRGGVSMWDVTDPSTPKVLQRHAGDRSLPGKVRNPALNEIHSVLGWTDGGKAYAVLVDNFEGKDVDILDISDPRRPRLISETDLNDFEVLQEDATPLGGNSFLHDVEVQEIGGRMTMVASYWDGGWTLLDVEDPANPTYLRDFEYPAVDAETGLPVSEGNAHQAEFSPDGRFIVGTDEDFAPYRTVLTSNGVDYQAAQGDATPQLDATTTLSGPTTFVGSACTGNELPPASAPGQLAVAERGAGAVGIACPFTEKAQNAEAAGYAGVVLFNSVRPDGCDTVVTPSVEAGIPTVSVSRGTAYALFGAAYDDAACLAGAAGSATPFAIGTPGAVVDLAAQFDGWGYVRLLNSRTMEQIDTYAIPESLDPALAAGAGDLSVHEVAVNPRKQGLAYLSYYAGGLRVIKYSPNGLREVGSYIAEGGNNFWGVESHLLPAASGRTEAQRDVILASDRDGGLFIFRYTGPQ